MPSTRVKPAAEELVSSWIGWRMASTVSAGAKPSDDLQERAGGLLGLAKNAQQ